MARAAESQGHGIKGVVRITASEVMGLKCCRPLLCDCSANGLS